MELAYDIIKKKKKISCDEAVDKFKSLDLINYSKKYDHKKFYSLIASNKCINISKDMFFSIIDLSENKKNIPFILLKSYYISCYPDDIFSDDKSDIENRLYMASNKLVTNLEYLMRHDKCDISNKKRYYNNLNNIIDNYLSIYNIWASKDRIERLELIFENINDTYTIIKCTEVNKTHIDNINYNISKMFLINPYFSTNILLSHYRVIMVSKPVYTLFWDSVKVKAIDFNRIFLIIIANLRIALISMLKIPKERKDLYYLIDVDEITDSMRNDNFTDKDISDIINIFYRKIKIISPKFKIKKYKNQNKKDIINIFANMFNEICV